MVCLDAIKTFRGGTKGALNAEQYVITHTKRFSLDDIKYALELSDLSSYERLVGRLDSRSPYINTINHE